MARATFSIQATALLLAALALSPFASALGQAGEHIEGRWLTFDGDTKARRALVDIRRQGPWFKGTIVELYLRPGEDPDPVCEECPGAARGKKIRGLEILSLEAGRDASEFQGRVLDPEEGRVYRCTAVLEPGGKRLALRGYVVLPLFGRSEIWIRAQ